MRTDRGHTLVELLVAIALILVISAAAVPRLTGAADAGRARAAAYYMSSRFSLARTMAAHRSANVAFRFEAEPGGILVRAFADANGNGVRSADIRNGIDITVLPDERLDQRFHGVRFGFVPGARLIDGSATSPGDDPIRFGPTDMLTFSPSGTATSGTVYIRGSSDHLQFAVVVLGATGRTRITRFDVGTRRWIDP